jgi:hypothetical protein
MLNGTAKETEGSWVIQCYNELVDTGNQVPARLNIITQVWDFIWRMLGTLKGVISGCRGFPYLGIPCLNATDTHLKCLT